jgi:predicted PurR-regulated permease PerM
MDITSFSLGILFVVVVGMLAVTVYNLFRVQKINKELRSISEITNTSQDSIWSEFHRMNSNLDSRLDKLIHRLDRLERERLGTTRDDESIVGRVKKLQKELLND